MVRIKTGLTMLAGALFVVTAISARAQPEKPAQLMVNISVPGEVSGDPPIVQVACTIVTGTVPIAVLAEAETPGTDAVLVIADMTGGEPVPVDDNDDFTSRSADDLDLTRRVLRLPLGRNDALAVGIAQDQAICAFAGEANATAGPGKINLQINDLSSILSLYGVDDEDGPDVGSTLPFLRSYTLAKRNLSDWMPVLSDAQIEQMLAAAGVQQLNR